MCSDTTESIIPDFKNTFKYVISDYYTPYCFNRKKRRPLKVIDKEKRRRSQHLAKMARKNNRKG